MEETGAETLSHSEPPHGAAPTQRKQDAREPNDATDTPAEAGRTTNTEQPKPRANATEPQEPEPQPENDEETATPAGQAPSGKATSKPRLEAHHDTKAADLRANDARHTRPPTKNDDTEKTEQRGSAKRTHWSTPEAQPTPTGTQTAAADKNARAETTAEEPATREPEKATHGKEPTKEESETMTKPKK